MKVQEFDNNKERKLITLLITEDEACKKLLPIINPKLLKTPYAKYIAEWVSEYYIRYNIAPKQNMQDIYEAKKEKLLNESEVLLSVGAFLTSLSEDYDKNEFSNLPYHLTDCEEYVRTLHLKDSIERVNTKLMVGKLDEAEALFGEFKRVGVSKSEGVSFINDIDVFERAFSEDAQTPLFHFTGDLHKMCGDFYRGDLTATLSTSKAGKSWYLEHVAESAMSCSRRVLVINLEMRENEMYQRYWRGLNWAPMHDTIVNMPSFSPELEPGGKEDDDTMYRITSRAVHRKGVSFEDKETMQQNMRMKYRGGDIVFMSLPSYTTTVNDIEAIMDNLEYYNNFNVDVLVVDYADLLGSKEMEFRHRMNDIWLNLRRVAQQRNIHVSTVSQANRQGLDGAEITLSALAEDSRKANHTAAMYGLWATEADQKNGFVTMKKLVGRYKVQTFDSVVILQCLDLGKFYVTSKLKSKVVL